LPDRHVLNPRLLLDIAEGSLLADWWLLQRRR
jgi:hypothetical protein